MCKNTCRMSFLLVACTLFLSHFRPILCEEDDSKPPMEDLNQLRFPSRELADTHTGDFPNQKKLAISIKKTVGGSRLTTVGGSRPARGGGSTPAGGGGSSPVGGGGSSPAGGGGSPPVIGAGAAAWSGSKSAGSRTSSSFNGGCFLSIVILFGSLL